MAKAPAKLAKADSKTSPSRRDSLLDEAARQFNASGVSQTSLAEIADTLDVSRAALYYYIDDREDLVFQVYRRSCERLARHLGEAAAMAGSALDVVQNFVARSLNPDEPELAALTELGVLRPTDRETVMALYEGIVARLAAILEAGAKAGAIRHADFPILARTVVSLIHWIPLTMSWTPTLFGANLVDRQEIIGGINDLLASGWAADRGKPVNALPIDLDPLLVQNIAAFDRKRLAEAKREAILVAASRLFNRKGVDITSLDEIAAELGATKRTLYHHVGDKNAIVTACYERVYRISQFIENNAYDRPRPGFSEMDLVVGVLRANAIALLRPDIEPLRPTLGFGALSAENKALLAAVGRHMTTEWQSRYSKLQSQGEVRAINLRLLLTAIPGGPSWLSKGLLDVGAERRAEIATEVVDVLRLGLKPI